jgi:hypothetical protein
VGLLEEAVGMKEMLQSKGVKIEGSVYGSLMALAGKCKSYCITIIDTFILNIHTNDAYTHYTALAGKCKCYPAAQELYIEAAEGGISPTIYMESALLTAAISA